MSSDDRARSHGSEPPTLPRNLTIAIRHGGRITSTYESASITTVTMVYPLEAYEGLIRFYDDALAGWACSRSEVHGTRSSEYSLDSCTVSVNHCIDTASAGFEIDATCVAITQVP